MKICSETPYKYAGALLLVGIFMTKTRIKSAILYINPARKNRALINNHGWPCTVRLEASPPQQPFHPDIGHHDQPLCPLFSRTGNGRVH